MEYLEVIKKRRSIRKYKSTPVSQEIIDAIIESARLAPSGGNGQGWLFGVITDKKVITQLSQAAGNQTWIATAPLVIALCARLDEELRSLPEDDFSLIVNKERFTPELIEYLRKYPDQRSVTLIFANGDTLIPGEHIALTAVNFGLSACWVGNLDTKKASRILNLPDKYACFFLMPIGYQDEEPRAIPRKPVEDIAFKNSFENKYHFTRVEENG